MLRGLARFTAYAIALLMSAVWLTSALASLKQPLFDVGRAHVGDAIIAFADMLALPPDGVLRLAHMLAGLKLLLGAYLLTAIVVAAYERVRWRTSGDEMLGLALYVSAVASIVAASPVMQTTVGLQGCVGELMLCAIASGLAAFARGPQAAMRARGRAALSAI